MQTTYFKTYIVLNSCVIRVSFQQKGCIYWSALHSTSLTYIFLQHAKSRTTSTQKSFSTCHKVIARISYEQWCTKDLFERNTTEIPTKCTQNLNVKKHTLDEFVFFYLNSHLSYDLSKWSHGSVINFFFHLEAWFI